MPPLTRSEFSGLNPSIVDFDVANDLLAYVYELSIGASKPEQPIIEADIRDAYKSGVDILRKNRQLMAFVRNCGKLAVAEEYEDGDPNYVQAVKFAQVDTEDPDAVDLLDRVIERFGESITEFELLYGNIFSRNKTQKAAAPKKPTIKAFDPEKLELPDDRRPISKTDVAGMDFTELSDGAKLLMQTLLKHQSIRMRDMPNVRGFKKLYGTKGLEAFKKDFSSLQIEIEAFLFSQHLDGEWLTSGYGTGMRYVLTVIRERLAEQPAVIEAPEAIEPETAEPEPIIEPIAEPVVEPIAEPVIEPVAQPVIEEPTEMMTVTEILTQRERVRRAAEFATKLAGFFKVNILANTPGGIAAAGRLAKELEQRFPGTTREESKAAINNLLDANLLFRAGNQEGHVMVAGDKETADKAAAAVAKPTEKAPESYDITDMDRQIAEAILIALKNTGHYDKKITFKDLFNSLNYDEEEVRKVIRLMVGLGMIIRTSGWSRSRSPHSRKKHVGYLQFPSQAAWNQYRDLPTAYMAVMNQ